MALTTSNLRAGAWFDWGNETLPSRVASALSAHEHRSEVLTSYLQLGILAGFTAVYLFAPKPDQNLTGFMPVYWVLPLYFTLTVIRLVVVRQWGWPDWALYISCVLDVVFLLALIWSFHLQYGQEPPFSLKVPTFVFFFLFIALRTLRLDPRFVMVSGLSAALGWMGLCISMVTFAEEPILTRSFVEYMNSNRILVGAEIEKTLALVLVTGVLALAVSRGRTILIRAVREESSRVALSRFFDPDVARNISESETPHQPGEGVRRRAAILNVDIRGFTSIAAEMTTEDLLVLLGTYQKRVVAIVRSHGGAVDKFMGDGILVTFGAVTPSDRYAADAMAAMEGVRRDTEAWNVERRTKGDPPLDVNCGVATGTVVFGCVGAGDLLEYTVIGDAVNVSAKLEKHNKRLGTRALATADAVEDALAQGYRFPAEPVPADEPIVIGGIRDVPVMIIA